MAKRSSDTQRREWLVVAFFLFIVSLLGAVLACNYCDVPVLENNLVWNSIKTGLNLVMDDDDALGIDPNDQLRQLASAQEDDRLHAIQNMARVSTFQVSKQVVPALIETMQHDQSDCVRCEAAHALNVMGVLAHEATPAMLNALGDDSGAIRTESMMFLVKCGKTVQSDLERQLNSTDPKRAAAAAMALSHFGKSMMQGRASKLTSLSQHTDQTIRAHVAFALGHTGEKAAIEALHRLLNDRDPQVRANAVTALGLACTQPSQKLAALQPLLEDDQPIVRKCVVTTLGHLENNVAVISLMNQHLDRENDPETVDMTRRLITRLDHQMQYNASR